MVFASSRNARWQNTAKRRVKQVLPQETHVYELRMINL